MTIFFTTKNPRLKLFSWVRKIKIFHKIKFNQEILTKLLKGMHQLNINLLCSSDNQKLSFCGIKQFFNSQRAYEFIFRNYC